MKSECDAAITKMYVIVTVLKLPLFCTNWAMDMNHKNVAFDCNFFYVKKILLLQHTLQTIFFSYDITESNVRYNI